VRSGVRRQVQARPLRRRHGIPAQRHPGGDRVHRRGRRRCPTGEKTGQKETSVKQLAAATVLAAVSSLAFAQSWGPRSLEELKQETIRRAERNMAPLAGAKAEDAREAMADLKSLARDEWAAGWSR